MPETTIKNAERKHAFCLVERIMRATEAHFVYIDDCKERRAIDPTQRHLIRVACVCVRELAWNNTTMAGSTASGKASCIASPNNKSYNIVWRFRRWMVNACAIIPLARFGPSENQQKQRKERKTGRIIRNVAASSASTAHNSHRD